MQSDKHVCGECGSSPCSALCPSQCPWGGDQRLEHEDFETGLDPLAEARAEARSEADLEEINERAYWSGRCQWNPCDTYCEDLARKCKTIAEHAADREFLPF